MDATLEIPGRWYASRSYAKRQIGIPLDNTEKDHRIDQMIVAVSAQIEADTDRIFLPYLEAKKFDYQGSEELILGVDLLSATNLDSDGETISSDDYFLMPLESPAMRKPYEWLELNPSSALFSYVDTKQSAITITGTWGYWEHLNAPGITLNGDHNDTTATTLTITAGGVNFLDIGQWIKIDSEYLFIRQVDHQSNTATVERAMGGSTAAAHTDTTAISIVDPNPMVRMATAILVARALARGDTAWSDRAGNPESGFTYLKALPAEVGNAIKRLQRQVYPPVRLIGRKSGAGRWRDPFSTYFDF